MIRELRIGNYIRLDSTKDWYPKNEGHWIKVESVSDEGINGEHVHGVGLEWQTIEGKFEPIPLTEDILLKCGFELSGSEFGIDCFEEGELRLDKKTFAPRFYDYDSSCDLPYFIEHLNQLQNLYFALTNEELKVNL
jgi:hypothetical protein